MTSGVGQFLEGTTLAARAFAAEAGHEVSWNEAVPAAKCIHVALGSSGSGAGLVGRLTDAATGDELDRAHGAESASLRACAPDATPRSVHVSIRVTGGKLDVVVGERLTGPRAPPR